MNVGNTENERASERASPPALIMQASGYELRVLRGFRVQFPWDTYHGLLRRHGKTRGNCREHDVSVVGCFVEEEWKRMVLYEFFSFLIGFSLGNL